jgi:hypothetical protein
VHFVTLRPIPYHLPGVQWHVSDRLTRTTATVPWHNIQSERLATSSKMSLKMLYLGKYSDLGEFKLRGNRKRNTFEVKNLRLLGYQSFGGVCCIRLQGKILYREGGGKIFCRNVDIPHCVAHSRPWGFACITFVFRLKAKSAWHYNAQERKMSVFRCEYSRCEIRMPVYPMPRGKAFHYLADSKSSDTEDGSSMFLRNMCT